MGSSCRGARLRSKSSFDLIRSLCGETECADEGLYLCEGGGSRIGSRTSRGDGLRIRSGKSWLQDWNKSNRGVFLGSCEWTLPVLWRCFYITLLDFHFVTFLLLLVQLDRSLRCKTSIMRLPGGLPNPRRKC